MPSRRKIFINGKFLCQPSTGVQKYAKGLVAALLKKHPDIVVLAPRAASKVSGLNIKTIGLGKGFFWEQICLAFYVFFRSDALLINLCNSAPLLIKKQIVTVHDLAFLHQKNWFSVSFGLWYRFLIRALCKRNKTIVLTVSSHIRNEIMQTYNLPSCKIHIIPNGLPEIEYDDQRPFSFPYLFITGVYNPRKNTSFVFSMLDEIQKLGFHVVASGAEAGIYRGQKIISHPRLHLLGFVSDREYYSLLHHAVALIYPSHYEGFGIPVLEALSLGVPVLLPDVSYYRETFDDLPLYYKPDDKKSFLQALKNIKTHQISKKQVEELKNIYNFELSAEKLYNIIEGTT